MAMRKVWRTGNPPSKAMTDSVTGHVAEIGVQQGKLLIALAHPMQPGSKATAVDDLRACTDHFAGQADGKVTNISGHPELSIFP